MNEQLLTRSEVAVLLGATAEQLQQLETGGVLVPVSHNPQNEPLYSHEEISQYLRPTQQPTSKFTFQSFSSAVKPPPVSVPPSTGAVFSAKNQNKAPPRAFVNPASSRRSTKPLIAGLLIIAILFAGGISVLGLHTAKNSSAPVKSAPVNQQAGSGGSTASSQSLLSALQGSAHFSQDVSVGGPLTVKGSALFQNDLQSNGKITAPNLIYGIASGSGIVVGTGQTPIVSNSGVLSLNGTSGDLKLIAGSGLSLTGLTLTNTAQSSTQNIFSAFAVSGQTNITAGSTSDTVTFVSGSGVILTTDATNKKLTIASSLTGSQWTTTGNDIYYKTGNVGIGNSAPAYPLDVTGNGRFTGTVIGSDATSTNQFVTLSQLNGANFWQSTGGSLAPLSISNSINVGSTATTSAYVHLAGTSGENSFVNTGAFVIGGTAPSSTEKLRVVGDVSISGNVSSGTWQGSVVGAAYGGTGFGSSNPYTIGDILYADTASHLSALGVSGNSGKVLTVSGGLPTWATSASTCTTCIINNPSLTQTITPSSATAIALSLVAPASGSVDIFNITNNSGNTKFFSVDSSGNAILDPVAGTGAVGIGTTSPLFKLDVQDSQAATAAAMITNTNTNPAGSVLALKVGVATNPSSTTRWLTFLDGTGRIVGNVQGNGAGGVSYATNGVDFAEYYRKADSSAVLDPGTLVCFSELGGVKACSAPGVDQIVGIVSDRAGFVGGSTHAGDENYVLVGMVGQLPAVVASTSGSIKAGDPLTISKISGQVTKAVGAGQIVGHATDSIDLSQCSAFSTNRYWSATNTSDPQNDNSKTAPADCSQTVNVAVAVSWYDPAAYSSAPMVITPDGSLVANTSVIASEARQSTSSDEIASSSAALSHDDYSNQLSALSDRVSFLEKTLPMQAVLGASTSSSSSAITSDYADLSNTLKNTNISLLSATISGTLQVAGRTTVNDLGVTGLFSSGVLVIDGLSADIHTISGSLQLQADALGNVELEGKKVVIDTSGNITASGSATVKKINIDETDQNSKSIGKITIAAGETEATVETSALTANSHIFVTPESPTAIGAARKDDTHFVISLQNPMSKDLTVHWWIVN